MRTYGKGSAQNNSMFKMFCFCVFFFFFADSSYSFCTFVVPSLADVISCFIYSEAECARALLVKNHFFIFLSLFFCSLCICIAYAKYLLCIYVYDLNLIICLITFIQLLDENVYKLHVQLFRMHVFVIIMFLRIAAIGSTQKQSTHSTSTDTSKHISTPTEKTLWLRRKKNLQDLFIERENKT